MATIQIRNVPNDVHSIYRRRAADAGMSLQEYLLAELTKSARYKTPHELVAEVEHEMRLEGPAGFASESSAASIRADRDAH